MSSAPAQPEAVPPAPTVAVLVLYGLRPSQSETLRTLLAAAERERPNLILLLHDNSPTPSDEPLPEVAFPILYHSDLANPGLAAAYNAGLRLAVAQGAPWLMLLDQDTALTPKYLAEAARLTAHAGPTTFAIVPRLLQDDHTHSPHRLPRLSHHPLPEGFAGLAPWPISAFNSAALIRVAALERIGGFPPEYPLDFLDHAVFHRLQEAGGQVQIMHAGLRHDLSTTRLGGDASLNRYRKVLAAERRFYAEPGAHGLQWYRLRRLKQALGHLLKQKDKRFAAEDLRAALGLKPGAP